jgi:hypothetical protein
VDIHIGVSHGQMKSLPPNDFETLNLPVSPHECEGLSQGIERCQSVPTV